MVSVKTNQFEFAIFGPCSLFLTLKFQVGLTLNQREKIFFGKLPYRHFLCRKKINFPFSLEFIFSYFESNKKFKNENKDNKDKYAVDSTIQFLTKSILRCMVFTRTTRQLGSYKNKLTR